MCDEPRRAAAGVDRAARRHELEADAEYARSPSLRGDLAFLVRTVLVVLRREEIYGGEGEDWRAYLARTESDGAVGSL